MRRRISALAALALFALGTIAQASFANWFVYLQAEDDVPAKHFCVSVTDMAVLAAVLLIGILIGFYAGRRAGRRSPAV